MQITVFLQQWKHLRNAHFMVHHPRCIGQGTHLILPSSLSYMFVVFNLNALAQASDFRTYTHTYMFDVVNFDALAQANDFRSERRQFFILCWIRNSYPGSLEPNLQQIECPLTNQLSCWGSSYIHTHIHTYTYTYSYAYTYIYIQTNPYVFPWARWPSWSTFLLSTGELGPFMPRQVLEATPLTGR